MYYGDLGDCFPPQPPLFDLYNSSDHTQPGPIIAKYLILLFQLVLDDDLGIEPDRDNKKSLIPTPFFLPFFIYLFYIFQLEPLISLVGVNLIITDVFSSLMTSRDVRVFCVVVR